MRTMIAAALAVALWPQPGVAQNGLPLASQRKQATPPAPYPYADYGLTKPLYRVPLRRAPALKTATVGLRLEIGMRGIVTRCTVIKSSGQRQLDDESCEELLFDYFQPATDSTGRAMPSTLNIVMHWRLGGTPPPPPPPMVAVNVPMTAAPKYFKPLWPLPREDSWSVKATPRNSPQSWITNDDYPARALMREEQGTVDFALVIDAAGVPLDCMPTGGLASSLLEDVTCDLMVTRARFNPARNAQGILVPSTWRSRMRWELPDGVPERFRDVPQVQPPPVPVVK